MDNHLKDTWKEILADSNYHIIVAEEYGMLVSSCVCVVIPNLTRNVQPYALVENVVTHENYRNRGLATACLNYAREIAKAASCYKIMLMTGAEKDSTFRFYEQAGYNSSDKKAFVQWICL